VVNNADWLAELKYIDFLRDIGQHFSVNRMLTFEAYKQRLETGLSFLEFNYQLLQAYDFLHLFRARGCGLQVGGADQWGNMISGVELIRRVHAQDRHDQGDGDAALDRPDAAWCLTYPLLVMADGAKMGKTASGAVWLDPELFSPFAYYQYWVNCHDQDVGKLLRLFTELPLAEIDDLIGQFETGGGAAINKAKATLAYEATKLLHGDEQAELAKRATEQAFGSGEDWSALPLIELAEAELTLLDLVVHDAIKGFKSKREARERIKEGAVKVGGEVVTDPALPVTPASCGAEGLRVQIGKKRRLRVSLRPA
jgi:tyrosyl-tRNA synthetase